MPPAPNDPAPNDPAPNDPAPTAALILAGGRSRRMGRPKALLPWGATTVLERVVANLREACGPVLVLARDGDQGLPDLPADVEVWFDTRPDRGPLSALAEGLARLDGRAAATAVCACDHPFFDAAVVRWLATRLADGNGVLPRAGGHLHPLTAVYRPRLAPDLASLVESGRRDARAIVELPGIRVVAHFDELAGGDQFTLGLNTPDEYRRALARAGLSPSERP